MTSAFNPPHRPLAELLAELETAVRAGNRMRAAQLAQLVAQRLATEAADRLKVERRVKDLLRQLDQPLDKTTAPAVPMFGTKDILTRGGTTPTAAATERGDVVYPVWFGTNRKPQGTSGDGFTGERHREITRGRVDVYVPAAHRFGETGSSFWTRLKRRDLRDDHLRIQTRAQLEREVFYARMQEWLQTHPSEGAQSHALFFLHGYRTTFDEAAIRAAQLGVDLGAALSAFFSWPSRGSLEGYPADEATIEASERAITDFLVEFATQCPADKLHVIAHSMGNRGLLRALQRIAANAELRGKVKFGQIFLAAPDVDQDLFLDLARHYGQFAERTTLYASSGDWPVWLSDKYHAAPRAGYFEPYTVAPGIDTVAVPDFDIDLLGHSYFAQAEALLYDIASLMEHGAPVAGRRMPAVVEGSQTFWRLRQ